MLKSAKKKSYSKRDEKKDKQRDLVTGKSQICRTIMKHLVQFWQHYLKWLVPSLIAHKLILAAQSEFFKGLFRNEKKEQVTIDMSRDILKIIVDSLYTGQLHIRGSRFISNLHIKKS